MNKSGFTLHHRLSRIDVLLLAAPLLLLGTSVVLRPVLVEPQCSAAIAPESCRPESLPAVDQWTLRPIDRDLEGWSDFTQNSAGILAFSVPLLHAGMTAGGAGLLVAATWGPVLTEWVLFAEATAWNAAINEWVRMAVQRPRPLLLTSDERRRETLREQIGNYNSFYSGHTSFAFLAATLLITRWRALRRAGAGSVTGVPSRRAAFAAWTITSLALTLAAATGILRVASGRHYSTDVIAGAIVGSTFAWLLRRHHLRRP